MRIDFPGAEPLLGGPLPPQTHTGLRWPAFSREPALHRFQKNRNSKERKGTANGRRSRKELGVPRKRPGGAPGPWPRVAAPRPGPPAAPAAAAHTCSARAFPAAPVPRGCPSHPGGHNEIWSSRARRRRAQRIRGSAGRPHREAERGGGVGRDTHEEEPRRRPQPRASRLTQRAAAPRPPLPAGAGLSPRAASPPQPPSLSTGLPTPGAQRRLFPFNGPGPAPALPPALAAPGGRAVSLCPARACHPLRPGPGRSPAARRPSAPETEGRSWDPGMRGPAPTPRRGRHGRGYCPCAGMKLCRGPRRPGAAGSAGP